MCGALPARGAALRANGLVRKGGSMNYVMIGSGVAGIAAIEAIRSVDGVGNIVMIGDDPHGFYSRPGLAYYLTGELHDQALYPRSPKDFAHFKFRSVLAEARMIDRP